MTDCLVVVLCEVELEQVCSCLVELLDSMHWLFLFSSMTVRLVLDLTAPAGFSTKQVNIPASSIQVFRIIIVEEVALLSIDISSLFFNWKVYRSHFTTGIGLASNSTLNVAASVSRTATGSRDLVKIGAIFVVFVATNFC